jgi:hypothetical protein
MAKRAPDIVVLAHGGYAQREALTDGPRTEFPHRQGMRQQLCPAQSYNVHRFTDHVGPRASGDFFWDKVHFTAPVIHKMNALLLETLCSDCHRFKCS